MKASLVRRTALRTGALVLGSLAVLLPAAVVQAAPARTQAEIELSCDRNTWEVKYTAGSTGHAPGARVRSRIDISTIDEYGQDRVTGEPAYGLGAAATTGDVYRVADPHGAWSTHEVLSAGPRPSGYPRSHTRTTTVTLQVDDGRTRNGYKAECTLSVG
ncbi:hypothetical protein ACFV7Q_23740 [Streptomyces sp. NPDC059851]|uniref:hypothetical protein n=1 Tax=Streptomyces sp. NPDC059851 TaxID=3346971 RepID=UPI0036607AE4